MSMTPMSPTDREAIGQLRTLLRGDHQLSVEDEEQLIADFLVGRIPALTGGSLGRRCAYLPGSLQPVVIQAGVIGVVAGMGLALARMSGYTLYTGAYREGSQLGLALVGMGFVLAAPVLWLLLSQRLSPATRMALTGTATTVGAGVLEWAALHWLSTDPLAAWENFMNGNLWALSLAGLVLLWSASLAWWHMPKPKALTSRQSHARRLASNEGTASHI